MAEQDSTQTKESARPGNGGPRRRDLSPLRAAVLAIACLVVAAAIAGGYPRARTMLHYQTWSQRGPREAAERFCEAVRSGDAQALRAAMASEDQVIVGDDGTLAVALGTGPKGKTVRAEALRVDQSAMDAPVRYDIHQALPSVAVAIAMPSVDCQLLVYVDRVGDGWKVTGLRPDGPGMGEVMRQTL